MPVAVARLFPGSFKLFLCLAAMSLAGCAMPGARSTAVKLDRAPIQIALGQVRPPLEYRIVSFHKGKADKRLVKLAAELGFNGVQIQLEGSTVDGVIEFKEYDKKEHLVDYCHSLGMKVTVWVHELSDIPGPWMPESFGAVTADNDDLWDYLDERYDWLFEQVLPNIDGICLTVVETEVRVTDPQVMTRLVQVIRGACDRHGKSLQVRTFVWYPDEFAGVMAAVDALPRDTVIMSKCVPQDWNLRGIDASEIGHVGGRKQIEEFDVCGEYFLRDYVANAMLPTLQRQFDYGIAHGIDGICVRVDRDDNTVLNGPNEVNLWALGMFADGATDKVDDVWNAWATNRYGAAAAPGVIRALRPTGDVVAEMLDLGPFTFGDTRKFPPLGDEDIFGQNFQSYWWDWRYLFPHEQAELGAPAFTADVLKSHRAAMEEADQCLLNLEAVRDKLSAADYQILRTKLLTNKVQIDFRTPMAMAVLHYRRMISTDDPAERAAMDQAIQQDLHKLRQVALPIYDPPREISYLGQKWEVGAPEAYSREAIYRWAYDMDLLRMGEDPRDTDHRRRSIWH
jgi:hypothetical protein